MILNSILLNNTSLYDMYQEKHSLQFSFEDWSKEVYDMCVSNINNGAKLPFILATSKSVNSTSDVVSYVIKITALGINCTIRGDVVVVKSFINFK